MFRAEVRLVVLVDNIYIVEYSPFALRGFDLDVKSSAVLGAAIDDYRTKWANPRLWDVHVTFTEMEMSQGGAGGVVSTLRFIESDASTDDFASILDSLEAFLYGRFNIIVNRYHREIREPVDA